MKSKHAFVLALLITLLIASNVYFFKSIDKSGRKIAFVSRVIDGDTLELKNGEIIRLLNINTPEKNEQGYDKAKNFLRNIENKSVEIEEIGTDKYSRTLARIYSPEYLNFQIVKEGLAKKFLVQESELKNFANAEKNSIEFEKGIWKKSQYSSCISSKIKAKEEQVLLENSCENINFKDWTMTDESRKKYKFKDIKFTKIIIYTKEGTDNETILFWNSGQNIWNDNRDTLYLFDKEGKIAHYNVYGY